jgi:hypothetical protein
MASKEVEVLDPAPTVEKLKKFASERVLNRRHFIAALGVAGAAAAGTELVRSGPTALAQQPKPSGYAQSDVLNFLLNIKYLKATLYSYATQGADLPAADFANLGTGGVFNAPGKVAFAGVGLATTQQITDLFNEMYYDELNQLMALRALLGSAVSNRQTMNLLGTGVTTTATTTMTQPQFIGYARLLEDLSVSAFAGATVYLTGTNLEYTTQALAVNGFHSGAVRLVAMQTGAYYYSGQEVTLGSAGAGSANSFNGLTTAGSAIVLNTAPTNPIVVGSQVSGPGILEGTVINSVVPITAYSGQPTNGSNSITGFTVTPSTSPTVPQVGQTITGTGIPAFTTITAVSGSSITMSASATVTPAAPVTITTGFNSIVTKGSAVLTGVSTTAGLANGQLLTGTGIPSMALISSFSASAGTVTMTAVGGGTAVASASSTVAPTGIVTSGSTIITSVSSVSGIAVGQPITGTGIPGTATVSAFDPVGLTITMSTKATATSSTTSSVTPTAFLTKGSNIVTALSALTGLNVGATVSGTGIASGTTVASVGGVNTMTLSQNAVSTTSSSVTVKPAAILAAGNNILNSVYPISGTGAPLSGYLVTDSQGFLPPGTTISSVSTGNYTITLSAPATGSTVVSTLQSFTGTVTVSDETISSISPASVFTTTTSPLTAGQPISGTNIPSGTIITAVSASTNSITISQFPSAAAGPQIIGAALVTTTAETLTALSLQTITVTTVVPTETVTIPTIETVAVGQLGVVTLSQNATATAATGATLTFLASDPMDVEPNDPGTISFSGIVTSGSAAVTSVASLTGLAVGQLVGGPGIPAATTIATITAPSTVTLSAAATAGATTATILFAYLANAAALAAGGPIAIPGTSPTAYQGFFDTAGASTSSANNPAGEVFARTFSQVLAVLYGSTVAQTYEGGFFPNGVSGNINNV